MIQSDKQKNYLWEHGLVTFLHFFRFLSWRIDFQLFLLITSFLFKPFLGFYRKFLDISAIICWRSAKIKIAISDLIAFFVTAIRVMRTCDTWRTVILNFSLELERAEWRISHLHVRKRNRKRMSSRDIELRSKKFFLSTKSRFKRPIVKIKWVGTFIAHFALQWLICLRAFCSNFESFVQIPLFFENNLVIFKMLDNLTLFEIFSL